MTVIEKAYAKVNLYLDVTARRDDGFHEILSLMHSVSLCDTITLTVEPSEKTLITLTTDSPDIPTNENNIAYRSALEYMSHFHINAKVNIDIKKLIPIGAGLGGGSSDAAATLRALNKIFTLASMAELMEIGAKVGSDLPFCIVNGLCLCRGRGESVEKVNATPSFDFVIAIGKERISTPKAYAELDKHFGYGFSDTDRQKAEEGLKTIREISNGHLVQSYNAFEQVSSASEVESIKRIMQKNNAVLTLMSGSGPAVFGIFDSKSKAEQVKAALTYAGFTAYTCTSVYPEENI